MAANIQSASSLDSKQTIDLYDNPDIPIRHMDFRFDPEKMAKYCTGNDPLGSAFIMTFSAFIPEGEKLVINAIRSYRDEVTDPELKARITGLIGQEAMHSKVHEAF